LFNGILLLLEREADGDRFECWKWVMVPPPSHLLSDCCFMRIPAIGGIYRNLPLFWMQNSAANSKEYGCGFVINQLFRQPNF
jgi:hypothetical protein